VEGLVRAASDFIAAVLSGLGFVGRPRRRAGIRDDLDLLDRLRDTPEFGPDSSAHAYLSDHITQEIARLSGIALERTRKIAWSSVVMGLVFGLPLAYVTYRINQDGFNWISLLPGILAAVLLLGTLGLLMGGTETSEDGDKSSTGSG
jgi:hypothetical protein